ncbi:hypothetical protein ACFYOC_22095 [Nocardiopsis alba]|uniref:hypothetical protein n=1 Tax=Nocardiopsis alba TaxID=53437 RepID=UPI00367D1F92
MRAHGSIRIVLTVVLLVGLAGCSRTGDDFMITNDLDSPIQHWTGAYPDEPSGAEIPSYSTKPGASIEVRLTYEEPGFPWGIWPISYWAPASCRDDLYLIVEAEDGRRLVHEPPLCDDGHWVISE